MDKNEVVSALAVIQDCLESAPDESMIKGCAALLKLLMDNM